LKKYVKANNTINATDNMFDSLFNKALKAGVDKGIFEQPKGMSYSFDHQFFHPMNIIPASYRSRGLTCRRSFWWHQALQEAQACCQACSQEGRR
jgi:hypothetical protein